MGEGERKGGTEEGRRGRREERRQGRRVRRRELGREGEVRQEKFPGGMMGKQVPELKKSLAGR